MKYDQEIYRTVAPDNVFELFELYKTYCLKTGQPDSVIPNTQTTLVRYVLPALGLSSLSGKRSTVKDLEIALSCLKSLSLKEFAKSSDALESYMAINSNNISKKKRRVQRSYLRKLLNWAIELNWIIDSRGVSEQFPLTPSIRQPAGQARPLLSNLNISGKLKREKYSLGTCWGDYTTFNLHLQLKEFRRFLAKELNQKEVTIENNNYCVHQFFGWLYRFNNIQLDDLSLEQLVSYVPLKLEREDFKSRAAYLDAQADAKDKAKEAAKKTVKLAEKYMEFYSGVAKSRLVVLNILINIAKFLYKNDTDYDEAKNFEDIPVVQQLRRCYRTHSGIAKVSPKVVPYEKKSVPWPETLKVLWHLKQEADLEFLYHKEHRSSTGRRKDKRSEAAIATSIQRFLIVSFLVMLPPDRQQFIRSLEMGKTLVKGAFINGLFVPVEKMSKPSEAEWYSFLSVNEYKTGNTYGKFEGRIPNFNLGDKSFYDYIELWVSKYRATLVKPNNEAIKHMFIKPIVGTKFTTDGVWSLVRSVFMRFTGVPVNPHSLRHCYRTFLNDSNASVEVKRGAAIWMKHDELTAEKHYNQQPKQHQIEPVLEYNQKLVEDFFNSYQSPK